MGCVSSKIMTRSKTFHQHLHLRLKRKTSQKVEQQPSIRTSEDQSQNNIVTDVVANDEESENSSSMPASKRNDPKGSAIIHLLWLISGSEDGDEDQQKTQQQLDDNKSEELQKPIEDIVLSVTDEEEANTSPTCRRSSPSEVVRETKFVLCEDFNREVNVPSVVDKEEEDTSEISARNVEIWLQESSDCSLEEGILDNTDNISEHIEKEVDADSDSDSNLQPADSDAERADANNNTDDTIIISQATSPFEPEFLEKNIVIQPKNSPNFDGLKKKVKARRHKRIETPSFEFSTVGSLREWLGFGGGVLSPGSYPTPKFGNSTNLFIPGAGGEPKVEDDLFDPEWTTELQIAAKDQSTVEKEDHILKNIFEGFEDHEKDVESTQFNIVPLCH